MLWALAAIMESGDETENLDKACFAQQYCAALNTHLCHFIHVPPGINV